MLSCAILFVLAVASGGEAGSSYPRSQAVAPAAQEDEGAAIAAARERVRQVEELDGEWSRELAESLLDLGKLLAAQADHDGARPLFERALAIYEHEDVRDHRRAATASDYLGILSSQQGNYPEARQHFSHALAAREAAPDRDELLLSNSYINLGNMCYVQGEYTEATRYYELALAAREDALGPDHSDVAVTLNNLGNLALQQGDYAAAERHYGRALTIWEKGLGPGHRKTADARSNLGLLYVRQGRYAEAEPLLERARHAYEATLGPEHPQVAACLGNLALLKDNLGEPEEAEALFRRVLAIQRGMLGDEHPNAAITLSDLANLLSSLGRFGEAEPLYLEALAIQEAVFGGEHPDVATSLNNLGALYFEQSDYDGAERHFQRALDIRLAVLGPRHPTVASTLNNLASIHRYRGRLVEAERLYEQAIAIHEKALGADHPELATWLTNLGSVYVDQAYWAGAGACLRKALAILEKKPDADRTRTAHTLCALGTLCLHNGRDADAEASYLRSLALYEEVLGENHLSTTKVLHNLATLRQFQGRFEESERLYRRSLAIREECLGETHRDVAPDLRNLARLLMDGFEGRLDEAVTLNERAIEVLEARSSEPKSLAKAYTTRAELLKRQGDAPGAIAALRQALQLAEEMRPEFAYAEETLVAFHGQYSSRFDLMVDWLLESGQLESALEYAEMGRARVLQDQLAAARVDLRAGIPPEVLGPLEAREAESQALLAEYQRRIDSASTRADLAPEERDQRFARLKEALDEASQAQRDVDSKIKAASPLWRDLITSGGRPVALETIQRELVPEKGLLLLYQVGWERSHLFVISPEGQEPVAHELPITSTAGSPARAGERSSDAIHLDRLLFGTDDGVSTGGVLPILCKSTRGIAPAPREGGDDLDARLHALWQILVPEKLRARLAECREVVVIPDGELHRLPFEALVVEPAGDGKDARYWLDVGPAIRYAPSATTLYTVTLRERGRARPPTGESDILSLSDPVYDVERAAGASHDQYQRSGGTLVRLPGSVREAEMILQAFEREGASPRVTTLAGLEATEDNLRTALIGKRYVHLATHGLVNEEGGALFAALALTPRKDGAAHPGDDGLLHLSEIYRQKLHYCELAVLSACRSHGGYRVGGEGVFALSRGFLVAGASRVVASQWSVDDASTAALIGAFFRNVAAAEEGEGTVDFARALWDAKREIRSQERWSAPFHWAPFILTGVE